MIRFRSRFKPELAHAIATLGSTLSFFFFFLWPWHKFHQKSKLNQIDKGDRIRMDKASGKKTTVTLPTSSRWSTKISKHSFLVCASTASETAHPRVCQTNPNQHMWIAVRPLLRREIVPTVPAHPTFHAAFLHSIRSASSNKRLGLKMAKASQEQSPKPVGCSDYYHWTIR